MGYTVVGIDAAIEREARKRTPSATFLKKTKRISSSICGFPPEQRNLFGHELRQPDEGTNLFGPASRVVAVSGANTNVMERMEVLK